MSLLTISAALVASAQLASVSLDEAVRLDQSVILPEAARHKEAYVRFYGPIHFRDFEDLPFTSVVDLTVQPGPVLVGVFVIPGEWGVAGPPNVRVMSDGSTLPSFVHGGCRVVNIVLDIRSGSTLGSWCNVDQESPPGPLPPGLPSFVYLPGEQN